MGKGQLLIRIFLRFAPPDIFYLCHAKPYAEDIFDETTLGKYKKSSVSIDRKFQ